MATERQCLQCGAKVGSFAPEGLCPACLLRDGLTLVDEAALEERQGTANSSPSLLSDRGRRLGDYELLEVIAHGGMGVVYKARQLSLNRIVALKLLLFGRQANSEAIQRFHAEAVAAASLHHPHIVPVYEIGACDGQRFFVMEYIEGSSLAEVISDLGIRSSDFRRMARYVRLIAEAVHYAHEYGVLHRDLKPSNILIDANDQPRVMDFGLAKRLDGNSELTLTGQVLGSPSYIPPEQAAGKRGAFDRRSDVYALGAILYHALTGRPPFVGEGLAETVQQVLEKEPIPPRWLNASVPRDLETICLKCLDKEPSRRYATAQLLAEELERFLGDRPVLARPVGSLGKTWHWCRRKPLLAGLSASVLLLLLVILIGAPLALLIVNRAREQGESSIYAADMNEAQRAIDDHRWELAIHLLTKHRPTPKSAADTGNWEWRYLWQLCQSEPSLKLQPQSDGIEEVRISANGKVLAAKRDRELRVWDLLAQQPINRLARMAGTGAFMLSPTGGLLGVGSPIRVGEPTLEIWDLTRRKIQTTLHPPSPIHSLAFARDETLMTTFDTKGSVAVVDLASGQTLTNLFAPQARRTASGLVAFSPEGSRLAIGSDCGYLRVLDWRTGTGWTNTMPIADSVTALAFSPTQDKLAAAFSWSSGTVHLWKASTGESHVALANPPSWVRALAFSADGQLLAAANADRSIRIWSVADQVERHYWRGHVGEGAALAFLSGRKTLVSGCPASLACLWDLAAGINQFPSHTNLVVSAGVDFVVAPDSRTPKSGPPDPNVVRRFGLTFTGDSQRFITSDRDGALRLWDLRTMQALEALPAVGSRNWGVALSPDDRWLATGNDWGQIQIWTWPECRLQRNLAAVRFDWLGLLSYSPSGRFFMTHLYYNDQSGSFRIWRTQDWEEVALKESLPKDIACVALSADDRRLAVGCKSGAVQLWRLATGRLEATFTHHTGAVNGVRFSPDSRLLVATCGDGTIRLWDAISHREGGTFRAHLESLWGLALSPDGRLLAAGGGSDREHDDVKVWDLGTQRELLTLRGDGQFFLQLAFSPDGSTLVAISFAGKANLWRAPSWAEIEAREKSVR